MPSHPTFPGLAVTRPGRALLGALWLGLWTGPAAAAPPEAARQQPPPTIQYREVRPPPGSGRRGLVPVPAWVMWTAAGAGAAGTVAYLTWLALGGRGERHE